MNWYPLDKERILRTAESLSDDADADLFSRWIGGVVFAVLIAGLGVAHLVAAVGSPSSTWLFKLWQVRDAKTMVGIGVCLLAAAAFMHAHYFWTPHPHWHAVGRAGKAVAALVIVGLLLAAVFSSLSSLF